MYAIEIKNLTENKTFKIKNLKYFLSCFLEKPAVNREVHIFRRFT